MTNRYCHGAGERLMERTLCFRKWMELDDRQPARYAGKKLFIGFVTDLYSRRSRPIGVLVPCSGTGVKLTIAAKNDLIRAFPDARVSLPVNTLDEAFKNDMDDAVSIARWLDVS